MNPRQYLKSGVFAGVISGCAMLLPKIGTGENFFYSSIDCFLNFPSFFFVFFILLTHHHHRSTNNNNGIKINI